MVFTCAFMIVSLFLSNILTKIFLTFHSTILPLNRNILTNLNSLLIICMNICASVQVSSTIEYLNYKTDTRSQPATLPTCNIACSQHCPLQHCLLATLRPCNVACLQHCLLRTLPACNITPLKHCLPD